MQVSRYYGCVTMMVSLCSGGYLVYRFLETQQRQQLYNSTDRHFYNFRSQHRQEIGGEVPLYGQPDDGNGFYMQKNTYSDWYTMAVNKRIAMNDYEHLCTMLPISLVNGIVFPKVTTGLLVLYFASRACYSFGYVQKEGAFNRERIIGSVGVNLARMGTMATFCFLGVQMARGKPVLQQALKLVK